MHYIPAAVIAFCVAVSNNFWWNRHWTFDAKHGHAGFQAMRFLTVSVAALGINLIALELLIKLGCPTCRARRSRSRSRCHSTSSATSCGHSTASTSPRPPLAGALALIAFLLSPGSAEAQHQPTINQSKAIEIARDDPKAIEALREHPDLSPSATRNENTADWEVGFAADGDQLVQVVVDDVRGDILESWSGHQVAWRMARGYPGAFGRAVNSPWVWLTLCFIFVVGLFDWRRPLHRPPRPPRDRRGVRRIALLLQRGGDRARSPSPIPRCCTSSGERCGWASADRGGWLRPSAPIAVLAGITVLLVARIALNVMDSNVIDVGYSG